MGGTRELSKEELIIELMKSRTAHREIERSIRGLIDYDYPADKKLPVFVDDDDPEHGTTTNEWAYRIACYAYDHAGDKDDFSPYDISHYGLKDEQSETVYMKLRKAGIVKHDTFDL